MLDQWDLAITSWTSDWQGNRARTTLGGWMDTDFAPGGYVERWYVRHSGPGSSLGNTATR
jgi:hypothetical protein